MQNEMKLKDATEPNDCRESGREKIRCGISIVFRKFLDRRGRSPEYGEVREFFYWSEIFRALQYSNSDWNETFAVPIFDVSFDSSEPPESETLRSEWESFLRDGSPIVDIPSWIFTRMDVIAMGKGLRIAMDERVSAPSEESFFLGPER